MRRIGLACALAGVVAAGCNEGFTNVGGPGYLALTVQLDASLAVAPTSYRVYVDGPTSRTLTLSPGSTESATGLDPGSYTVAVEGLVGSDVEVYGERGGITVQSDTETSVTANFLTTFMPTLQGGSPTSVAPGTEVPVSWSAVTGASEYRVEWAGNPGFSAAQTQTVQGTSTTVTALASGQMYVRIRALNRFGGASVASGSLVVAIEGSTCGPSQTITHLLGDTDGIGRGLTPGDELTPQIFDDRTGGDPFFTDVNPAFLDNFPGVDPKNIELTYSHTLNLPGGSTIVSGSLRMLTLGVQDGDNQVQGSDTDIQVFFDGVEVPGAFDDVDQFRFNGTAFVGVVGEVTLDLPASVLSQLADGSATVRINTRQLGSSSGVGSWATDYSELSVCVQ